MPDYNQIANALSGFGAGVQGQGAQFAQSMQNRKLIEQEQQAKAQELDKERVALMVQDAWMANQLLDQGKAPVVLKMLENRIENIKRLKGDPSDTQAIYDGLVSGDPEKVAKTKQELQLFSEAGIAARAWQPPQPKPDEGFTLGEGQQRFDSKGNVIASVKKTFDPNSGATDASTAPARNLAIYKKMVAAGDPDAERFAYMVGLSGRDIDSRVTLAQREAEARAAGGVAGKDRADATIDLLKIESSSAKVIGLVNELLTHKGKSAALGASSYLPSIRGTERAGFDNRLKQIQGDAFLKAFESLKGGGAITEMEGQKATQALNRMNETVNEEEFDAAAKDFISEVNRFKDIAAQRAKGGKQEQTKGATETAAQRLARLTSGK